MAVEIAAALPAPLDLVIVRKVGVPNQPELAMGAVIDASPPVLVRNEEIIAAAGVSQAAFEAECERQLDEARRRRRLYLAGRAPTSLIGKTAIVVDDGIATGATMRVALRHVRAAQPRRLVLAVPVAARRTLASLRPEADDVVCLEPCDDLGAVGAYYRDFTQVADAEVVESLRRFSEARPGPAGIPRRRWSAS